MTCPKCKERERALGQTYCLACIRDYQAWKRQTAKQARVKIRPQGAKCAKCDNPAIPHQSYCLPCALDYQKKRRLVLKDKAKKDQEDAVNFTSFLSRSFK